MLFLCQVKPVLIFYSPILPKVYCLNYVTYSKYIYKKNI